MTNITIREYQDGDNISEITTLLHKAYKELADMGFRYWATHQNDEVTKDRLEKGISFLAIHDDNLVGTVTLTPPGVIDCCKWYRNDDVSIFSQFAVKPSLQRQGIGTLLSEAVETRANKEGFKNLAIDTADKATHLIDMYKRWGYEIVEYAQWGHTNFQSVIMNKVIC